MPRHLMILILLFATLCFASTALAREVYIQDWGMVEVDNEHFVDLQDRMKISSLVKRAFYDAANDYLLVKIERTFLHYCGIPQETIDDWLAAPSPGDFYRSTIEGNYDCQTTRAPEYRK